MLSKFLKGDTFNKKRVENIQRNLNKNHAKIIVEGVFVGLGEKFQIWEPKRFEDYLVIAQQKVKEQRLLLNKKNNGV